MLEVTRHPNCESQCVSRHRRWLSKKPYRAVRIAAWSVRSSGGSPAHRMSASISLSRNSTITHRKRFFRLTRWRRMRRADAEHKGSVSARDASDVPESLAIVFATCCRSNARPSANRKYQEFTTVGTVSHSLSRRSNEGATNGPKRLGVGERSVLLRPPWVFWLAAGVA
jgi:hypothetical protein